MCDLIPVDIEMEYKLPQPIIQPLSSHERRYILDVLCERVFAEWEYRRRVRNHKRNQRRKRARLFKFYKKHRHFPHHH